MHLAKLIPTRLSLPVLVGLLVFAFSGPAPATWSIVVSDAETGEIAIGCATCLNNFKLKKHCGVMVVGKGAGQAQAWVDVTGKYRKKIANKLKMDWTADEILEVLKQTDPQIAYHQYGIVDLKAGAASYTGSKNGAWASGLTGKWGRMAYAIQGNMIAGEDVVIHAEQALIHTPGDLGQKLMAAMHAAKEWGGDGRCSCNKPSPMDCGTPPVRSGKSDDFWKSAHVAYMVVSRIGDKDGEFTSMTGFACGSYYMDISGPTTAQDPVDILQDRYDAWRAAKVGKPDHILSDKTIYPKMIRAGGLSTAKLMIALIDVDDQRVKNVAHLKVTVSHDTESAGTTLIGPVTNHGDGTFTVTLTSTQAYGTDVFRIEVSDVTTPDENEVTLYPFPTLEVKRP